MKVCDFLTENKDYIASFQKLPQTNLYVAWNEENKGWWKEFGEGYINQISEAGIFSEKAAEMLQEKGEKILSIAGAVAGLKEQIEEDMNKAKKS